MPYKIIWEPEGVVFKWSGKCTYEENLNANGKIYGDKRFSTIYYQIGDFLEADTSGFTKNNVKVIAKLEIESKHMEQAYVGCSYNHQFTIH